MGIDAKKAGYACTNTSTSRSSHSGAAIVELVEDVVKEGKNVPVRVWNSSMFSKSPPGGQHAFSLYLKQKLSERGCKKNSPAK